eukprot:2920580-Amphidinium_carterae.2
MPQLFFNFFFFSPGVAIECRGNWTNLFRLRNGRSVEAINPTPGAANSHSQATVVVWGCSAYLLQEVCTDSVTSPRMLSV